MTTPTAYGRMQEEAANLTIAKWLNSAKPEWTTTGERRGLIEGESQQRPDIIIRQGDRMPVIIECEWGKPAVGDARKRLGKILVGETRKFSEAIAVGIDKQCEKEGEDQLHRRLEGNEGIFTIQLISQVGESVKVWPEQPLPATPADLIAYSEYAQVPQAMIDEKSAEIARRVKSAGIRLLDDINLMTKLRTDPTLEALKNATGAGNDEQATQTTCAIWLIAIDLQNDLARNSEDLQARGLKTTSELKSETISGAILPEKILEQWRIIESVDYLPVIELAIKSLEAGEMGNNISDVLGSLNGLSNEMNALYAKHIYNFAGELWQRLVSDREERAAHYTKPEIAELLATLSAQRFRDWSTDEIAKIDLMDAACGTGTLIGAGERALRRLYALKGGNDLNLHRNRMQEHIIALDVNGIAGTLTAKRLTDMNVEQDYAKSKIAIVTHEAGSLSLLDPKITGITDYLGYGGVAATPGLNSELGLFHIAHGSINWSLMNPPYSRPRKGRKQATTGLTKLRQAAAKIGYKMSHGQAGLASDFGNMSNMRMAHGGTFAHVLPLTAARAESWQNWRAQMEKDFENIVAIANVGTDLESMSADTAMNEMLVVATKRQNRPRNWQPASILCINLNTAPTNLSQGYAMAQEIASIPAKAAQGLLTHGNYSRIQQNEAGFPWGALGNSNNELTTVGTEILNGNAYDPLTLTIHPLIVPITSIDDIAGVGPTHHSIGYPKGGDPIGAFEWIPLKELATTPAQQSMWESDARTQTSITMQATHGGQVKNDAIAKRVTPRRSHWFIKRDLRWTSQATAIGKTPNLAHGGPTWNALQINNDEAAKATALFYNSTLGAILRNAYANSTQAGRARVHINAIAGLPCPAFNAETPGAERARQIATSNFERLSNLKLQPFAYCFRDTNRHEIDLVVAKMLGLDPDDQAVQDMLEHYRLLFASEPNVNGRQKSIVKALDAYKSK